MKRQRRIVLIHDGPETLTFTSDDGGKTLHPECVGSGTVLGLTDKFVGRTDILTARERRRAARAGIRGREGAREVPPDLFSEGYVKSVRMTGGTGDGFIAYTIEIVPVVSMIFGDVEAV
jgi:hypothetical protein